MLTRPRYVKYNKRFRCPKQPQIENRSNYLKYSFCGLQSLEKGKITAKQIEAVRRSITNALKRRGKVWIRIFPNFPITAKPTEVRMGKGKGNVSHWVALINPGKILFEVSGANETLIINALKNASIKLPVKTRIVRKAYSLIG